MKIYVFMTNGNTPSMVEVAPDRANTTETVGDAIHQALKDSKAVWFDFAGAHGSLIVRVDRIERIEVRND